jgi:hypothetical protein
MARGAKKPLLDKNAELLSEKKTISDSLTGMSQRFAVLEKQLAESQAVNNEVLLHKPLVEKLRQKGVFEVLLPELSKTITETYGLQVNASGNDFEVIGKTKDANNADIELTLDQVLDTWSKLDNSKDCIKPQDIKTESTSPDFKGSGTPESSFSAGIRRGARLTNKD